MTLCRISIRGSVVVGPEVRETIVLDETFEHVGV